MNLPYDYTPAVLFAIDLISEGATKTAACDESNITVGTFEKYIDESKELEQLYRDAFIRGSDALADSLLIIDRHERYGHSDPKMAKVVSDNIKWLLAKRDSKRFGDRIEINHTLTADKAITEALLAGQRRALESCTKEGVIDVEVVEEDEDALLAELLS